MSRSILSIHIQRFRISTGPLLILATGTTDQVIDHVQNNVDNKLSMVSIGVKRDGQKAMALYIDVNFDGDLEQAKQGIDAAVIKSILGGYKPQTWNFFSAFNAHGNKIDTAIGDKWLGSIKAVQQFAKDITTTIFGKGGYVAGSTTQTKTLLLFALDSARTVYAWNYENDKDAVIDQPFGDRLTRYTYACDGMLAVRSGSGEIKAMSFQQIAKMVDGAVDENWNKGLQLQSNTIEDLSLGVNNYQGGQTVIATGIFGGQAGLQTIEVKTDSGSFQLALGNKSIEVDDITSYGSPVRYDGTSVTFVNRNGGQDSVTRIPLSQLSATMKTAFTQQGLQA